MYSPPTGQHLTAEQARELDDTFLASDPFQYFRSRIASLMAWHENAPVEETALPEAPPDSIRDEFNRYLQRPATDGPFKDLEVHAQIAADALAVRHHAAEALVRFACAVLAPSPTADTPCLWSEVATGPTQIQDAIDRLNAASQAPDASERMLRALVEPTNLATARTKPDIVNACNVLIEWLGYAIRLLTPAEIDLQAGHNKVKHGLAVRARSDLRVTFLTTGPTAEDTIAVSALNGPDALDIFDQPVVELLARGPKVDGHRQGLEVTQLRLKPSALLADAYMLAMAHGTMFHVAAVQHFADRGDLRDHHAAPAAPGYPVGGPKPEHIDAQSPLGMRFVITLPPGGGPAQRETGIGFREYFQTLHVNYDGYRTVRATEA